MAVGVGILVKTVAAVVFAGSATCTRWGSMDMRMEENKVELGQTIHLDCSWNHDDDDAGDGITIEVKWFFNDDQIHDTVGWPQKYQIYTNERDSTLEIININRLDQGNYTCLVGYEEHWARGHYLLDLHLPAQISIVPTGMPRVGVPTHLVCKTVGKPNSNISWGFENFYRDKMDPRKYIEAFPGTTIHGKFNKTGTFLIVSLTPKVEQTGPYFCHSADGYEYANLTVKGINIDCTPRKDFVMLDGKASFECDIMSIAQIDKSKVKWKRRPRDGMAAEVISLSDPKYKITFDANKGGRMVESRLEVLDINIRDIAFTYELFVQVYAYPLFQETWQAHTAVTIETGGNGGRNKGDDSHESDDHDGPNGQNYKDQDRVVVVNHTSVAAIVGITMGAIGLILILIVAFICYKKRRTAKKNKSRFDPNYIYQYEYHGEANTHARNPTFINPGYHMPPPKLSLRKENTYVSTMERERLEFPRDKLQLGVDLGEGRFGKVIQGRAMNITGTGNWVQVAVKTCRSTATDSEKHDLYQELEIMRKIPSHPNIVVLYGCCSKKDPLYIIMEYVHRGSMLSYLRKCRPTSRMSRGSIESESTMSSSFMQPRAKDLTIFALQIARGMAHVANIGIIHRDLAARNILLATDFTCKICDFGLARDVEGVDVYERTSKGPLPIRWMSPESLDQNMYTKKSDVWSYGVLIWEIVTLGATPYQGMSAMEVMRQVLQGFYLPQPLHCREEMYDLMIKCWEKEELRPSFAEIVNHFEALMDDDYIILSEYDENDYTWLDSFTMEERV